MSKRKPTPEPASEPKAVPIAEGGGVLTGDHLIKMRTKLAQEEVQLGELLFRTRGALAVVDKLLAASAPNAGKELT